VPQVQLNMQVGTLLVAVEMPLCLDGFQAASERLSDGASEQGEDYAVVVFDCAGAFDRV
jgi:hypothetical protein